MTIFTSVLEQLNLNLFLLINASAKSSTNMLLVGTFFARDAVVLFPLILLFNLFRHGKRNKKAILLALFSMLFAIMINIVIGRMCVMQHPRPFMIPLGQHFLPHSANNSFPSDHMSLACAISFSLIKSRELLFQGIFLLIISIFIAWARIYMGVHFPLDMVGSVGVAYISVVLSLQCHTLIEKVYIYTYERCYRILLSKSILKNIIKK